MLMLMDLFQDCLGESVYTDALDVILEAWLFIIQGKEVNYLQKIHRTNKHKQKKIVVISALSNRIAQTIVHSNIQQVSTVSSITTGRFA